MVAYKLKLTDRDGDKLIIDYDGDNPQGTVATLQAKSGDDAVTVFIEAEHIDALLSMLHELTHRYHRAHSEDEAGEEIHF